MTSTSEDGRFVRLSGEKAFGEKFREHLVHPLGVKKGVEQADRVIKFVAGFVGFAVEFGAFFSLFFPSFSSCANSASSYRSADFKQRQERADERDEDDSDDDEEDEDGPASRLVAQLLAFLLRGFEAKSKIARYRCVQLVALMINSLGEIECVVLSLPFPFLSSFEREERN